MLYLNRNSITSRLYRWFYKTQILPTSLCPYFYKVLFIYVAIIPYTSICIPYFTYWGLSKSFKEENVYKNRLKESMILLGILFSVGWGILMLLYPPIFFNNTSGFFHTFGLLGVSIGIYLSLTVGGIVYLLTYIQNKRNVEWWEQDGSKKPNIIIEFVKAKYKKYCPQINWK